MQLFKKLFTKTQPQDIESDVEEKYNKQHAQNILDKEVFDFFPKTGHWTSACFSRGDQLQCQLRNIDWLTNWVDRKLKAKSIYIPKKAIRNYVATSPLFAKLRHDYELEIVKWQIGWMNGGGEGWLLPKGADDCSLVFSPDCDIIFRAGVVKTLSAIGLDRESIEEGLEVNASLWRPRYMSSAFDHAYNPVGFMRKTKLEPASLDHKAAWLKMRRHEYYLRHKASVDKYSHSLAGAQLSSQEFDELSKELEILNADRSYEVKAWKDMKNDYIQHKMYH